MATETSTDFQVLANNPKAQFTLKLHRGESMLLLAMNWKNGKPPKDFVGFTIEYKEPGGDKFYSLKNRICFLDKNGKPQKNSSSTLQAPIQKFRWVHFPRNAELEGEFIYKVKPVFMNDSDELSYGESQQAKIRLARETYKGKVNVCFTRGFVSSQAFVDKYVADGSVKELLPAKAKLGVDFKPTHPKTKEALEWMGFEAREAILKLLDQAIADKKAKVKVVAYDLSQAEVVAKLEKLGSRLEIIIDDSKEHGEHDSGETIAEKRLSKRGTQVKRQHMGQLQHNKTIVVDGPKIKAALCGSTNYTWRGLYVQANHAVIVYGPQAIQPFLAAFDNYWNNGTPATFGATPSADWQDLNIDGLDAKVAFSPHSAENVLLDTIADDMKGSESNLLYSLAFLFQTPGVMQNTIKALMKKTKLFIYGISDKKVGGLDIQTPNGNIAPVFAEELSKNLPEPFKSEPTGGGGTRMHHKFVVIDFDKPTARVYFGSYNFSQTADNSNGENLVCIQDRKIAVAFMIEALRLFDHYHFRISVKQAKAKKKVLALQKPPRKASEQAWWEEYYKDKRKIRDRELFA